MICFVIPSLEYENKPKWNTPSRFVNANPILIQSGDYAGEYAVPSDFLLPDVVSGSVENELLRGLLEEFQTVDLPSYIVNPSDPPPQPPIPPPFPGYSPGTLGRHLVDSVDLRLPGKQKPLYSTQNHASPSYVRNVNCWAYGLDLTCVSPWNSHMGGLGGGVLVTNRHLLSVAHFPIQGDAQVRFITNDNQIITRTIIQRQGVTGDQYVPDFQIYLLDSDIPNTITSARILPSNYANYLNQINEGRPPVMVFDQEENCLVTDLFSLNQKFQCRNPVNSTRILFYEDLVAFDSGNPFFLIINNQLVILGSATNGGSGAGTFITSYIPTINQLIINVDALASISTGYTVQTIDLSGFPTL